MKVATSTVACFKVNNKNIINICFFLLLLGRIGTIVVQEWPSFYRFGCNKVTSLRWMNRDKNYKTDFWFDSMYLLFFYFIFLAVLCYNWKAPVNVCTLKRNCAWGGHSQKHSQWQNWCGVVYFWILSGVFGKLYSCLSRGQISCGMPWISYISWFRQPDIGTLAIYRHSP